MKSRKPVTPALKPFPSNWRLGGAPKFARLPDAPDDWLVLGRAEDLPKGQLVRVQQFSTNDVVVIEVLDYVAEKIVRHRRGSYSHQTEGDETRWVLATFTSHPELEA